MSDGGVCRYRYRWYDDGSWKLVAPSVEEEEDGVALLSDAAQRRRPASHPDMCNGRSLPFPKSEAGASTYIPRSRSESRAGHPV